MTMKSYRVKEGAYGSKICYQYRIQHYIEWDLTLTRKMSKFRVCCKLRFKKIFYNIGKKCQKLLLVFVVYLLFFEDAY